MALVAKRKQGQSTQQLISEFKKLTYEDQEPSKVKNIKMTELRKASARIRRRNKRNAGITK
ncbi:MAG: hypothetical protein UW41_C0016G0011 [Candidatus Collierbacteria bacterium GW2011_GWC2_44_18]|uniref:Uncharacterized protein n=1 Tax=Candidatus Collierbacteria bacterium GW2011_GWC2_44_18 TaxID=1618392 RepID=A0A0G1KLP1_9BACT|nr:MAG: hypothetical protein UW41_C0016G0011 [Candidatus Collierbacteria bacterium GW2011_GWC2_44_18]